MMSISYMHFAACALALLLARGAATGASPERVALGSATGFAVLAGSTITSTGDTFVNGDLGLYPGTSITGTLTVSGTICVANPVAAQAQTDLEAAYVDAAGRADAVLVDADLGGQELGPGVYHADSSLAITGGNLTLDAGGQENAVFIFQVGSTLTTASGSGVVLAGGARSADVFWQVGTSASLGTYSEFKGTLMADQSITLTTGATVDGRVLARHGAITFDTNTVTTCLRVALHSADEVGGPYGLAAGQVHDAGARAIRVPQSEPKQFYRLLSCVPSLCTSIAATGGVVRVGYAWTPIAE